MDLGLFSSVLSKLSEKGIETVALHTLGDPGLANPRLPYVLEEIRSFNLKTSICTNGLLLDKHVDTLIEYIDVAPSRLFLLMGLILKHMKKLELVENFLNLLSN